MKVNAEIINHLNYLCRTYDGMNKLIVTCKNRLHALNPNAITKHQEEIVLLESMAGKLSRRIEKELEYWPIWEQWLKKIPGIGPYIAGNLILLYCYAFLPICKKCGEGLEKKKVVEEGTKSTFYCHKCETSVKGDGILQHKIVEKDFLNISSWWHYMGVHVKDGKKPKKAKGNRCDWSSKGRAVAWQIGESFVKQNHGHPYRLFYDERRKKRDQTHPEASPMHKFNMAKNETSKLFLAHFWQVARELDNKPLTEPYAKTLLGHTGIIGPYYWNEP